LNLEFLSQSTFEFFASYNEPLRRNIHQDKCQKDIFELQHKSVDREQYRDLESFYRDVFGKDAKEASSSVGFWILLGFNFESLQIIFTSAATFNVCMDLVKIQYKYLKRLHYC
jgi:hypothetical protein